MNRGAILHGLVLALLAPPAFAQAPVAKTALRFEVRVAPGLLDGARAGRLLVMLGREPRVEPRLSLGRTGLNASPVLGRDAELGPGRVAVVDGTAASFPIADLAHLAPGEYSVQALFDANRDQRLPSDSRFRFAPDTLYSEVRRVHVDPSRAGMNRLELTRKEPAEQLPAGTERVKYVKLRSQLLSDFHGRPIFLRAGIRLPKGFASEPERRYPLRIHIGGYGSRYFVFPQAVAAGDNMVLLVLDGAGPYGDPYQVNSDNNGPYGDAITRELIPYVEGRFRCRGEPSARGVDGGSTGGWVALALQIFYPDFFNGAWSSCPDPVDFRAFQLVDIYRDANAYVNEYGFERPGMRTLEGDVRETMRHQLQLENVLGRGDSWTASGQQWGAWNAVFGPRGADGLPVPLWNARTGSIDRGAVAHWKRYDLRLVLEENWPALAPRLRGKLHISVGEADDYFLNNAVRRLDAFLQHARPPYEGTIAYGPGKGHCWSGLTESQMCRQMLAAMQRN